MIIKGFRFGMLLQLAVGPVCVFVFQTASANGFFAAAAGVLGVTLIDGLYIAAAILGIASVIERKNTKKILKLFGAVVLLAFGISMVSGVFGLGFIPGLNLSAASNSSSIFLSALILTASNPLTIIFWAGVFSAKIAEESMKKKEIFLFGTGCVLATMFFLTSVALAGNLTRTFLPPAAVQTLNLTVGLLLVYFGVRMMLKKIN